MKKILSIILSAIFLISCVSLLSACGNSGIDKFDECATFISENGIETNGKFSITKNLSELGESWKDSSTVITISYDESTGYIVMEETTEYDDHTAYYKAICDKNSDEVNVYVTDTFGNNEYYYKGYILKSSFSNANRETAIYGFETNNAPFGQSNAKATLGVSAHILFSHTMFLLRNVNCPVSLNDLGFKGL